MKNILVVDDDAAICNLIQQLALKRGHKVWTAENGEQALDMCHLKKYDIVFTDLHMPGGVNGLVFANKIGSLSSGERPGMIILMTGNTKFEDEAAGPNIEEVLRKGTLAFLDRTKEILR